eukprot:CAMPEP_0183335652 /NCGR_PEP_ID=MMETSP0164_2-20130417/3889_1 /TAXON_ID=221442 /ORGANISM="Coccolithus pelagicus ssp braarudi, Strain PLY182g" /LENGTH=128 /DNA_ID=CAMNT_0025505051 /DNA_START=116 /DNA_END=499 /DNA_ORIENTATION=-
MATHEPKYVVPKPSPATTHTCGSSLVPAVDEPLGPCSRPPHAQAANGLYNPLGAQSGLQRPFSRTGLGQARAPCTAHGRLATSLHLHPSVSLYVQPLLSVGPSTTTLRPNHSSFSHTLPRPGAPPSPN